MGYIYKITNTLNNKIYIGQTSKSIQERYSVHLKCAKKKINRYLYDAMNKYGVDKFKVECIGEYPNDVLDEQERYWISYFNSNNREFGYNMTPGGGGGDTWTSNPHKEETIQKSIVTKKKNGTYGISYIKGMPSPNKGKFKMSINKEELYEKLISGIRLQELADYYGVDRGTLRNRIKDYFNCTVRQLPREKRMYPRTEKQLKALKFARSKLNTKGINNCNYVKIEDVELFKQMILDNRTYSYIADKFNISKPTVYNKCVELFNKTPKELRNDYK